jgi:hypothetical protein
VDIDIRKSEFCLDPNDFHVCYGTFDRCFSTSATDAALVHRSFLILTWWLLEYLVQQDLCGSHEEGAMAARIFVLLLIMINRLEDLFVKKNNGIPDAHKEHVSCTKLLCHLVLKKQGRTWMPSPETDSSSPNSVIHSPTICCKGKFCYSFCP